MYYHADADILPSENAVIKGENYRLTVLTPALIRLEYSGMGIFVDRPSQSIVNRNFLVPEFRVEETVDKLEIITAHLTLKYNKKKFSPGGLQIRLKRQFGVDSTVWSYGDEQNDLKGTARTLDGANGSVPLDSGILSADGWTLLDDSKMLLINEEGGVEQRADPGALDIYFFGYGRSYLGCLKDFYLLTGNVPLMPRFVFGNWWSRYYRYSETSYLELMDRFRRENIPFSVAVIDMDWHLTDIDSRYGTGWTGYSWNRELFPEPKRFMDRLHECGMKVTLNIHPAGGIRAYEDCYRDFAEYMGVDWQKGEPVSFDIGEPKFVRGYFEYVHHPLEKQGVDFWWIDWQQGNNSGIEGLDPLWMLNHCHYLDNCRNNNRGLIFSRYGGIGSHRYPIGFSGDSIISWESLKFQPYFTANASNVGYGWWSHDIGGHMEGVKDDELAVRWLQFGVFSPVMRLHSTSNEFNGKEPWRYNQIAEGVMKNFLRLRHKLIPYLYTMNMRASTQGIPLVQPMYYHHPYEKQAYEVQNEYYFGSEMIVSPITEPMDKESQMAKVSVWIPEGKWIDLFTGLIYEGSRRIDCYRQIAAIPVLAKCGSIIPVDGREDGNRINNPEYLELYICAGGDGEFSLWEDEGKGAGFDKEDWAETKIKYEYGKMSKLTINAPVGNMAAIPKTRKYRLRVMGTEEGMEVKAFAGTKEIMGVVCEYDAPVGAGIIDIPEISISQRIVVEMGRTELHNNQKITRIFDFLNRAEIEFELKRNIYDVILQMEGRGNLVYIISQLQGMSLRREIIGPIMEILASSSYEMTAS